ncbi:hypothetical protein SBBP1_740008 [Burkholderiales bacterium]|nr:hypothetical protein SBBP1_740008 [Burkholderiales bacterium]
MARKAKELTAPAVERLKTPGLNAVGGVPGLYLQVLGDRRTGEPTGARTWIFRYLSPTKSSSDKPGQKRRRHLGPGAVLPIRNHACQGARQGPGGPGNGQERKGSD